MSNKGQKTTSDYLDFDKVINTGRKLLIDDKTKTYGLFLITSVCLGLRVGDTLNIKWGMLKTNKEDEYKFNLTERKTKKVRNLSVSPSIREALSHFNLDEYNDDELVFKSRNGNVFTSTQLNRKLKKTFQKESRKLNISNHSLRKGFSRHFYNLNPTKLPFLCKILNHSSQQITLDYIGITKDEITEIYQEF
jgi:integrase